MLHVKQPLVNFKKIYIYICFKLVLPLKNDRDSAW